MSVTGKGKYIPDTDLSADLPQDDEASHNWRMKQAARLVGQKNILSTFFENRVVAVEKKAAKRRGRDASLTKEEIIARTVAHREEDVAAKKRYEARAQEMREKRKLRARNI